jgi:hypothetical protein
VAEEVLQGSAGLRVDHLLLHFQDAPCSSLHHAVSKGVYFLKSDEAHVVLWNESSCGWRGTREDVVRAEAEDSERDEGWFSPGER